MTLTMVSMDHATSLINECLDKCPSDFDVNIEKVPDEEDEPTTDGPGPATTDNHGLRGHHLMKPVMAYV